MSQSLKSIIESKNFNNKNFKKFSKCIPKRISKAYHFEVIDSLFVYANDRWKNKEDIEEQITDIIDIYGEIVKESKTYVWISGMKARDGDMQSIVRIYKKCIIRKTQIL